MPDVIITEKNTTNFPLWAAILLVVLGIVLLINLFTWGATYFTKPRTYVQRQYTVHVKS
jgi:hypothetical protein